MTMDWDPLMDTATQRAEASMQRDPRAFTWGMFAWGDASPAIGGGVGAFQWFATEHELHAFICDDSHLLYRCYESHQEWQLQAQRLRQLLANLASDPDATLQLINQDLRGALQFDWIGRYHDLCSGEQPFCRQLRQSFREDEVQEEGTEASAADASPLDPDRDDEQAWLEHLSLYGI